MKCCMDNGRGMPMGGLAKNGASGLVHKSRGVTVAGVCVGGAMGVGDSVSGMLSGEAWSQVATLSEKFIIKYIN